MLNVLVIGAGDRGFTYSRYCKILPYEINIVAVAEPDIKRRQKFADEFQIDRNQLFSDYRDAFNAGKIADICIITTPDNLHFEPTLLAMQNGYNILLEKPIANKIDKILTLKNLNRNYKNIIGICHVLRYASFYVKLKEMIDNYTIGEVMNIEHSEGIGWWHFAHSYVRGNWSNTETSSPTILAKSSHDMDLLYWYAGAKPVKISSFGSLIHFTNSRAPDNSSERCIDCGCENECPYSALKLYLDMSRTGWPVNIITDDLSYEGRLKALREGNYGRCVYRCSNNAVDHQTVMIEFENSTTASFTMSAFTEPGRKIRIMGTRGEISGDGKTIKHVDFTSGRTNYIDTGSGGNDINTGHGGGDYAMMKSFIESLITGKKKIFSSTLEESVISHIMAFAAEESRLSGKKIRMS